MLHRHCIGFHISIFHQMYVENILASFFQKGSVNKVYEALQCSYLICESISNIWSKKEIYDFWKNLQYSYKITL